MTGRYNSPDGTGAIRHTTPQLQMIGSKSKGLYVDLAGETALVARTSGLRPPFVIEELTEVPLADPLAAADAFRALGGARANGYAVARCGIYPGSRVVARIAVESRKLREEGYLVEHVRETLKIDPALHQLFLLSVGDGSDAMAAKSPPKDVLVCGALAEELAGEQVKLLELGLFPDRMELGSVAAMGGVVDYLGHIDSKAPTLLLEVGRDSTQVFVLTRDGVEVARTVAFGVSSMIPVVQKELALKDEESARKLFFSNSFDFTGMGPQLTKRLLRELQASIGFYEVQTGQSITQLCCTLLPAKVSWLQGTLADVLGMKALAFDHTAWFGAKGIRFAEGVGASELGPVWTGLLCLMSEYQGKANEPAA
jgi:hypothetical protein